MSVSGAPPPMATFSRLVGVIHLPPLPGSPLWALPMRAIVERTVEDARILEGAGYHLAMIENFGDTPFIRHKVPPVTIAAMTACAEAVRSAFPRLPLGINVLRNDAEAALSIAAVVGAACIRVNVHTGARVTDQGIIEGDAASTLRTRRALSAEAVNIWADVDVKHSAPLAPRPVADEASDLITRAMVDAILVTGSGTGKSIDPAQISLVRSATGNAPLYVASGARPEDLPALATLCDGVIVGSALRANGVAGGPVNIAAATTFAKAFRAVFPRDSVPG
ncbi:BtpA/SgcQ family protein [Pendulispora albinea]|uniref:BtpA/SgcQ family protein n=1 Tax=Pendulispora albinea TaxID=2741071 RepID=A0ABZ2LQQ7_9BACT